MAFVLRISCSNARSIIRWQSRGNINQKMFPSSKRCVNPSEILSYKPITSPWSMVRQLSTTSIGRNKDILVETHNNAMTITFNRPERCNAFTVQMYEDVTNILTDASKDDGVSVVKFTGAGDYYCSGNDLTNFATVPPSEFLNFAKSSGEMLEQFVAAFIDFPKPLIAAVNGPAYGIAVSSLGLFDAVYASQEATFQMPFTKIGQSPEACSSYIFPRLMGNAKASSLVLLGEEITAAEAERLNLVSKVFSASNFKDVDKEIEKLLDLPLKSLIYTKRLMRDPEREILHNVNKAECKRLVERWTSEDCAKAVAKFFSSKS